MSKGKKRKELKRISFDYYIWCCFMDFLDVEGNSVETENGKQLKEGKEYIWMNSPNRNPEQVPNGLWRRILYKHLKRYNDN